MPSAKPAGSDSSDPAPTRDRGSSDDGIRRPTATVVVPAWNAWEHTAACLHSLRQTLRAGDQAIVVDNGSIDGTAEGLAGHHWVDVVSNAENLGFARACNQGAALAGGEVVVFLNNDTILADGWLDELLAPFLDDDVGATGPRSDNVSGRQQVASVPYGTGDLEGFFEFARQWRQLHLAQTTEVARLVGFCLAVRRSSFEAVGGFDERYEIGGFEDDDLCRRLRERELRLLIAHASFIHHHSHATFDANELDWRALQLENRTRFEEKWGPDALTAPTLLSACLIVKDEEQLLPACLESLRDVVDEVVVYDTGSSDRTVELAREAGAQVVEGVWEDSFAVARNAALAEASGEWVLSIDADETLLSDPVALRTQLADPRSVVEAFLTPIENLHGAGNARSVHTAVRVFRRKSGTWRHRLHEQVVAADDPNRGLRIGYLSAARLLHHGYAADVFEGRNKSERNLALARAALDDDEQARPYALMNYGRALESAGRSEEAVECLVEAVAATGDAITRRLAVSNLTYILGRLERYEESLEWVAELRRISQSQVAADIAEGRTRLAMGETEVGLALLGRVPTRGRDDDGMEYAPHMVAAIRGEALASLGRYDEAADVVIEAISSDGVLEADLGELVRWLTEAGRSPEEITAVICDEDLVPVLGRVLRQPPALADLLLNGAFERFPDRLEPLAAAAKVAPALPVVRALVWSARLRARGLGEACPLVAIAADGRVDPVLRVRAGAAAQGTFGEVRVVASVRDALDELDVDARTASFDEIGRLAPELPGLLSGASATDATAVETPAAPTPIPGTAAPSAAARTAAAPTPSATHPRSALRSITAIAADPSPRRGGLNVVAPFEGTSPESDAARRLVQVLADDGLHVSATPYHWDSRDTTVEWTYPDAGTFPYEVTLLVLAPEQLVDFVLDNGPTSFEGRYTIGLWLWDLPGPAPSMANAARMVHEIWVASRAAAAAIRPVVSNALQVHPLPHGAMPTVDRRKAGLPDGFVFATTVDFDAGMDRQDPIGVVEAYRSAFADDDGCHLLVDAAHAARYPAEHRALVAAADGRPDVSIISDHGPAERDAVVAASDCYVSLARADSTCLTLANAMAWGTPVVTTSTDAARELLGTGAGTLVDSRPVAIPEHCRRGAGEGTWSEPDRDAAVVAMRAILSDPETAQRRARHAVQLAVKRSGAHATARSIRRRLGQIHALVHPGDPVVGSREQRRRAAKAKA